jgi:cell wall-associated NlpC family hydrolase
MSTLSIREIYQAACSAGFTPEQATTWTAIALAESGGRTAAVNPVGEHSVGLWQINIDPDVRSNNWGDLTDPLVNARAAYDISRHGTDMRPWTVTHASRQGTPQDYRTHLDRVEEITGLQGDDRGVDGYGAPLPPPLPSSERSPKPPDDSTRTTTPTYDQISPGATPGTDIDADQDGLTDAFEAHVRTKPRRPDSDGDGLSDGHEVIGRSDPRTADSDNDGLSDSTELSLDTSPLRWDSDGDGISDRAEIRHGSDPLPTAVAPVSTPIPTTAQAAPAPTTGATSAVPDASAGATSPPATKLEDFLQAARAQRGDSYDFGAETSLSDTNPETFDCSELVQWAAAQAGVEVPDGSMYQYLDLKDKGMLVPVEEALKTPGALLFHFSDEPTPSGGRPSEAHVAISLGDGKTIEARGTPYGVDEFSAEGRFEYAGVIRELDATATRAAKAETEESPAKTSPAAESVKHRDGVEGDTVASSQSSRTSAYDQIDLGAAIDTPPDSDHDGLSNAFEDRAGLNPKSPDTDDDGLLDTAEVIRTPTDPRNPDTDEDGISDATEVAFGTSPDAIDSDADGFGDALELRFGSDPITPGPLTGGTFRQRFPDSLPSHDIHDDPVASNPNHAFDPNPDGTD